MKTTFDEALAKIGTYLKNNKRSKENDYKFLVTVLDELREEYAPTIEMTQHDYEKLKQANIDGDSADWLDDIEWGHVDYKYPDFMQAWLHPETVKVIEEKNNEDN